MVESFITGITREGLLLVLIASGLPVLTSLIVGLLVSVFQATTQLQEQTLTFAPKLIAVFAVLALAGPWIGHQLLAFTFRIFDRFAYMVR